MKSDAEIYAEAREYLEKHGWWRGALTGPNGKQVCGLGAIAYSQGWMKGKHLINPEYSARADALANKALDYSGIDRKRWTFPSWNDSLGPLGGAKDKQAVLDLFSRAEKIELAGFDPDEGIVP